MKKAIAVGLTILCVGVFALGDSFAAPKPKPPKVQGEQVNGVSRINKSGDILGTIQLTGCPAVDLNNPGEPLFSVLVYVAGESIMARPAFSADNAGTLTYDFVLYNVPVPDDATVDVTAEVSVVGAASLATMTVPVTVGKHVAVTMEAPIPLTCPSATQ
ncbi:MAG: hypothetical protein AB9873_07540 [Syntrophobacteraceae bacterium]